MPNCLACTRFPLCRRFPELSPSFCATSQAIVPENTTFRFIMKKEAGNALSPYPHSTLEVSQLGLGTMTFGEQNSEADAHQQLDYAVSRY